MRFSTPAEMIRSYLGDQDGQLLLVETYPDCLAALNSGEVDAVTSDSVLLLGFVADSDGAYELVRGDNFNPQPYGIGLRKGDHEFRDWINDVIEEIVADGRYEQAWLNTAGRYDRRLVDPPVVDRY